MIPLVRGQSRNASSDLSLVHGPALIWPVLQVTSDLVLLTLREVEGNRRPGGLMILLYQSYLQRKQDSVPILNYAFLEEPE